ncbi:MAG TPA: NTP transferase domain-containing protein [Candidatus Acidoferrales bacterium]|nr:NTP transferase domain-containing protein [Candidatus Acidoferrales bacterium]
MAAPQIVPIILAAGRSARLGFPKPLARFGRRTAVEIAVQNCRFLAPPVVVLGAEAARVRPAVPRVARVVVNHRWRAGQLASLLAGLKFVPRRAAFLIYPVDYPRLDRRLIERLARAYAARKPGEGIVMPRSGKRPGHPVIFAPELRPELHRARTAREVAYRDPARIRFVPVRTTTIWDDFDSPASYRRLARQWPRPR